MRGYHVVQGILPTAKGKKREATGGTMSSPRVAVPVAIQGRTTSVTLLSRRAAKRANRSFLPEIQVLRAVAVTLVVLYHYWPDTLTGGYVGVDAFFVISGYLITSHLLREVDRTGILRLWAFYARRARRLLPASIFVLLFVALGTFLLLPSDLWSSTAHELAASGFYVQNLWLASKAVTYSASNDVASPVTHYWSLSAEEQFYLVWPALIILAYVVARRWLRGRTTTTVGFTLLAVTAGSFVFSVWATAAHGAAAYFITPTRAWEFGTGALVVLLMRRWVPPLGVAVLLRWLGLAGLLAAAWLFTGATAFPGYAAALPVAATAAVIVAGDTGGADPSYVLFRLRPVQWLGDASYSIYLWHWPLLMFAPYVLRHSLTTPELLVLILLCLVISGLSRRFAEDATRFWPRLTGTPPGDPVGCWCRDAGDRPGLRHPGLRCRRPGTAECRPVGRGLARPLLRRARNGEPRQVPRCTHCAAAGCRRQGGCTLGVGYGMPRHFCWCPSRSEVLLGHREAQPGGGPRR